MQHLEEQTIRKGKYYVVAQFLLSLLSQESFVTAIE